MSELNQESWEPSEIALLQTIVAMINDSKSTTHAISWSKVALNMPNRSAVECRNFWRQNPGLFPSQETTIAIDSAIATAPEHSSNPVSPSSPGVGDTNITPESASTSPVQPMLKRNHACITSSDQTSSGLDLEGNKKQSLVSNNRPYTLRHLPKQVTSAKDSTSENSSDSSETETSSYVHTDTESESESDSDSDSEDDSISSGYAQPARKGKARSNSNNYTPQVPEANRNIPSRYWSKDEDQRLVEAHQKHGADWAAIAKAVGTRGLHACVDRYRHYIRDPVDRTKFKTGRWTSDEDQRLVEAYQEYGTDWAAIAKAVGTRAQQNCRDRYRLHFRDPADRTNLNTGRWTSDEDQRLVEAHQKYGGNWAAITKAVGTRGQENCKDRYRYRFRHRCPSKKKLNPSIPAEQPQPELSLPQSHLSPPIASPSEQSESDNDEAGPSIHSAENELHNVEHLDIMTPPSIPLGSPAARHHQEVPQLLDEHSQSTNDENACAVCMCLHSESTISDWYKVSCGHEFHLDCLFRLCQSRYSIKNCVRCLLPMEDEVVEIKEAYTSALKREREDESRLLSFLS
jgi:hypothetical protein